MINDILLQVTPNSKMLVFGLGYDSKIWFECNSKNTFFVEDKDEYIELNIKDIPQDNIIKYNYKTVCDSSVCLTDHEIEEFKIPEKILNEAPFDIILIDGPGGYSPKTPGRLIPCYWSTLLSKPGTVIYIDDSSRKLETYCIQKFFNDKNNYLFNERGKCTKIYF